MVFEAKRHRVRREDRRYRDRHFRRHARLHAQGALRRGRADISVERPDLQRQRQACPGTGRRRQLARQTRRGDATFGRPARPSHSRGRHPRGCRQSAYRLWPHRGRRDHRASRRRKGRVHGLHGGRQGDRASVGRNLKKVTLELGGKSPVLIFDDADLDKAILMASLGIFVPSGQGCVCGSRIFVQRGVYDRVVEGIAGMANTFKLGGPSEEGCVSGPLISQKQLTRVMGFIDEGKSDGGEVVTGGHRLDRKGYFVHPTVLTNVDPGMRLYQQEIFGPVVSILPFDDEDEAVAMANDTTYGLAATAWTENVGRAHRIVKRLQAGSVQVNCQLVFDHDVPFGGYKQSGWGHEFGKEGIETYLKTKSVWAQL